jgi:CheY-like chemotaxis protein
VGDPLRLKQILLNLLGNAIKFTERGEVGLRIESARISEISSSLDETNDAATDGAPMPGELLIVVYDTGLGMDEAQLKRLFQRFEQADGARTAARYGGTGLGLAISRELALAMGGTIEVRSETGRGTEFELRLPLPAAPEVPQRGIVETEPPTPSGRDVEWRVILLVEDDPTVAEVLIGLLERQGHRVVHAAHGLAAMTEASLGRFDLALIDLDLPGIDGCALAEALHGNGFVAPKIAITARAEAAAESQAMAAGFVAFLRKPIGGERLRTAIAEVLASCGGMKEADR